MGGLFCLLLAGGAGQTAWAQSGGSADAQQEETEEEDSPRRLRLLGQDTGAIPQVERDPAAGSPVSIIPTPYVPRGALPLTRQQQDVQSAGDIESSELVDDSPAGIGLPDSVAGDIPADLWNGLSADIIALHYALPRMPSRSPAASRLAGDLVRAPFFLPAGGEEGVPQGLSAAEQGIIETRMRGMQALGLWPDLYAYWAVLPPLEPTGNMLRILAETLLMDGNLAAACQNVDEGRRLDGGAFWLELAALCAAFDASREQLEFFLGLLREQGDVPVLRTDLHYDILSEAEGLATRSIPAGQGPFMLEGLTLDPIALSAIAALELEPPLANAGALPPLVAKVLAERPDLPLELRANAALRAAAFNLVSRRLVTTLLADLSFSSGERATFDIIPGETRWDARRDGLLLDIAEGGETPEEKLLAARLLWQRGLALGTGHVLAPLIADALGTVRSNPEDAAWVVPMALVADDTRLARRWYSRLNRAAGGDTALETALARLYPLAFLAGLEGSSPNGRALADYLSLPSAGREAEKALAVLEALHGPLDRGVWEQRLAADPEGAMGGRSLPFALWRELVLAEELDLPGSMLSLSLAAAGAGSVHELDAAGLGTVLHALSRAGFEEEAQALAIEALALSVPAGDRE